MHLISTRMICVAFIGLAFCYPIKVAADDQSFIVGFHQKPGPSEVALIHGAKGVIKHNYQIINAMAVTLDESSVQNVKKNAKVRYVEQDAVFTVSDPLPAVEYTNAWGVYRILADVAHASGNKGAGVDIAILDTGIDYTHPELADNYVGGYDFVYGDNDPFENVNNHGTHVAGIIAGAENGTGIIGVAPAANLFSVRVLDSGGFGSLSWILEGIEWAVLNGMDVVNMSLEGMSFQSLEDACNNAFNSGVLLVGAAGNTFGADVRYPAGYDSVIAVTSTDSLDNRSDFSPVGDQIELAAPGTDVLSSFVGGGYGLLSGTSQAAPHVSGAAALFFATVEDINGDGAIDNLDVRLALQASAVDLGTSGRDSTYGYGLVNAAAASMTDTESISFSLERANGPSENSSAIEYLSGISYQITINNNDLNRVIVDVFEGNVYRDDLSSVYRFNDKNPQEAVFTIDASGTRFRVVFVPSGKVGGFADVLIEAQ